MSILPFLIFTASIIFIYHSQKVTAVNTQLDARNQSVMVQVNTLIQETSLIVSNLSFEPEVHHYLTSDEAHSEVLNHLISSYLTARSETTAVHVISLDKSKTLSTHTISDQYLRAEFDDWGIMHSIKNAEKPVVMANWLKTKDRDVVITIGQPVFGEQSKIVGYIILDIFRDYFDIQLGSFGENEGIILLTQDDIVVYNSFETGKEGIKFTSIHDTPGLTESFSDFQPFEQTLSNNNNQFKATSINFEENFERDTRLLIQIFLVFIIIVAVTTAYFARSQSRKLYHPIESMLEAIDKVKRDSKQRMVENSKHDEMKYLAQEFNHMLDQIDQLNVEIIEKTERESIAEIKALQAQISPHFLYNMLNEIKSLAKLNRNEEVSLFTLYLGNMLRGSIDNEAKEVTLESDFEFIQSYLNLQQIRYENAFTYSIEIDDAAKDVKIPKLILQPIIENSILHGFSSMQKGQVLMIKATVIDKVLEIEIYDNGKGVSRQTVVYINDKQKSFSMYGHHGLENIQKRLMLMYGDEYGISIESELHEYTRIKISIPIGGGVDA